LTAVERTYLKFGERFEREFLTQSPQEHRSVDETLTIAWNVLKTLPRNELTRIRPEFLERYGK
jgi:V/A-type H+/Na+-transporting ATPase subunit B